MMDPPASSETAAVAVSVNESDQASSVLSENPDVDSMTDATASPATTSTTPTNVEGASSETVAAAADLTIAEQSSVVPAPAPRTTEALEDPSEDAATMNAVSSTDPSSPPSGTTVTANASSQKPVVVSDAAADAPAVTPTADETDPAPSVSASVEDLPVARESADDILPTQPELAAVTDATPTGSDAALQETTTPILSSTTSDTPPVASPEDISRLQNNLKASLAEEQALLSKQIALVTERQVIKTAIEQCKTRARLEQLTAQKQQLERLTAQYAN